MKSKKPLNRQVIVVTGASSGIGRATAIRAAKGGASVVLTARDAAALGEVRDEIVAARRGQAIVVAGDVAQRADVERVAAEAIGMFGGIDTWVNNAGVTLYGRLDQGHEADHRRLFETNFWGIVNGSLVALDHMREAGGTIVNLGSVLSDFAVPIQGMYCASKHAVKGFTDSFRMEIESQNLPVSVTLIKPASIASPLVDSVTNKTGRQAKLPPPLYAPDEVAHAICHAAVYPRRDINVGGAGWLMSMVAVHAPYLSDAVAARYGAEMELGEPVQASDGNLHASDHGNLDHSRSSKGRPSLYTRTGLSVPSVADALGAASVAALSAISGLVGQRMDRQRRG